MEWAKTEIGWTLANMWYDQHSQIPEYGSPLSYLFMFVSSSRQTAQILSTKAIVQTALPMEKDRSDPAVKEYLAFVNAMRPYMSDLKLLEGKEQREELAKFAKKTARINLGGVWRTEAQRRIRNSQMAKRFKMKGIGGGLGR